MHRELQLTRRTSSSRSVCSSLYTNAECRQIIRAYPLMALTLKAHSSVSQQNVVCLLDVARVALEDAVSIHGFRTWCMRQEVVVSVPNAILAHCKSHNYVMNLFICSASITTKKWKCGVLTIDSHPQADRSRSIKKIHQVKTKSAVE